MRLVLLGGTGMLGAAVVPLALEVGHDVVVAHRGAHELDGDAAASIRHLHGTREALLAPGGPVEQAQPDALVDTFAGATAEKARQLARCATACGARVVAVSSTDVYQACLDAGFGDPDGRYRRVLAPTRLPIREDAARRRVCPPLPGWFPPGFEHDNAAMEDALEATGIDAVVLRPGMVYGVGPDPSHIRERYLVELVVAGEHRLELPWDGTQLFARVALERVARAVLTAAERPRDGFFAVNVVDPYGWTFAGLAAEVARILEWTWEPVPTEWASPSGAGIEARHPFSVPSPCVFSDERLRRDLGVGEDEPDPTMALEETVRWLWARR